MNIGIDNNYLANPYPMNGVSNISNAYSNTNSVQKSTPVECQTCKNRKYVDDSDDLHVSFKTPGHIDPGSSAAVVSSHEQEHVSAAIKEGNKEGNQLLSASVTLKMSICPECGSAYVSGGVTTTRMQYNEKNPYDAGRKILEGSFLRGQNVDLVA